MQLALIGLCSVLAGALQSVTGFGASVVTMLILPLFYSVPVSSSLTISIAIILNTAMVIHFHRDIRWNLLIVPAVIFLIVMTATLEVAAKLPSGLMLKIFGGFLIILCIYFLFLDRQLKLRASPLAASACSAIAGVTCGLFGISGPPMVVYYVAAMEKRESYLGTIQCFFLLTGIYSMILRSAKGLYSVELLPVTIAGGIGVLIGKSIGLRILGKLDAKALRTVIYIVLGITGVINLLQ